MTVTLKTVVILSETKWREESIFSKQVTILKKEFSRKLVILFIKSAACYKDSYCHSVLKTTSGTSVCPCQSALY